jgi:hypothetical protein
MEINRGVSSGFGWELSVSVPSTAKRVVTKFRSGWRGRVLAKFLDPGELDDYTAFAWFVAAFIVWVDVTGSRSCGINFGRGCRVQILLRLSLTLYRVRLSLSSRIPMDRNRENDFDRASTLRTFGHKFH